MGGLWLSERSCAPRQHSSELLQQLKERGDAVSCGACLLGERRGDGASKKALQGTEPAFPIGNIHLSKVLFMFLGYFVVLLVVFVCVFGSTRTAQSGLTTRERGFYFPRNVHFAISVVAGGHFVARMLTLGLKFVLLTLQTLLAIGC